MDGIKHLSLETKLTFNEKSFEDERYIRTRIKTMHNKKNPNNSHFSDESIEASKPKWQNIFLLANVVETENGLDFGAHDFHIENNMMDTEGNNSYKIIYDELPIGIVPESNNLSYEYDSENDKNYLWMDALIVRDYSNYAEDIVKRYIEEDKDIKVSMEISIQDYEYVESEGYYDIKDFTPLAITFLGEKYGTGMEKAKAVFNQQEISEKFMEKVTELKNMFSLKPSEDKKQFAISSEEVGTEENIEIINSSDNAIDSPDWGDINKPELRDEIMKKSNYKSLINEAYLIVKEEPSSENPNPDVLYPHHIVSEGNLIIHIGGVQAASSFLAREDTEKTEEAIEHINRHREELGMDKLDFSKGGEDLDKLEKIKQFALSLREKWNKIAQSFGDEEHFDGEEFIGMSYYWLVDAFEDHGIVEKFSWFVDGTNETKYFKFNYSFVDDECMVEKDKMVEIMSMWVTQEEKDRLESERIQEFAILEDKIKDLEKEFEILETEKEKAEQELKSYKLKERQEAEQEIFEKYEDSLAGVAEYDSIKEKASEFTLIDLEKEIALIFIKSTNVFSKKDKNKDLLVKEKINKKQKQESKYGDLFEKFGKEE